MFIIATRFLHALHEPVCVTAQLVPVVLRAQPAVSFSVVLLVLHAPVPQVNVETVRERVPEVEQVPA